MLDDGWPYSYVPKELDAIAKSIGLQKLDEDAIEQLQAAAAAYQWGMLADYGSSEADPGEFFPSSNKDRREQFQQIASLCERGAPLAEIETAVNELDALASQLFGNPNITDREGIQRAAKRALTNIPKSGPDPKRARCQFIDASFPIFEHETGRIPTRRVRVSGEDYGPFFDFVKAALAPFGSWAMQGCEADIKALLHRRKKEAERSNEPEPQKHRA
jgi:hypothetical protein